MTVLDACGSAGEDKPRWNSNQRYYQHANIDGRTRGRLPFRSTLSTKVLALKLDTIYYTLCIKSRTTLQCLFYCTLFT